jgi:hypothetical protein
MTTAVMSDYLEVAMLNHVLRNTAFTTPGTSIYVSLHTADPTDAGTGTEVSATGTAYARQQVSAWDAPSTNSHTHNTNAIAWSTATGAGFGHVTHIGIWDGNTGSDNLLFYGELTTHKDVVAGVTFSIAAGAITVTLGGAIPAYCAGAWLSLVLRNTAFTTPGTSVYVALYNTGPAEVTGTDYARVACAGTTKWDAPGATTGDTENTEVITFPAPGGASNLLWGPSVLGVQTYEPTLNDTVEFAIGALDITVS